MTKIQFETTVLSFGNNTGIEVPLSYLEVLGSSKKPPVMVTIGTYEYPSTVAVMNGKYLLPLSKEHREKTGIRGGDTITVTLTLIEGRRDVDIPEVLTTFLNEHQLMDLFNQASYSNRKEMVRKIVDAKKPETLQKRLNELLESLKK
jgi:competence transcription factor ComK